MGYTTTFIGSFELNKNLDYKTQIFLEKLNETRRMKRNLPEKYGIDGEFYVFGGGEFGQSAEADIIDYNSPPSTQPSLWCQWKPTRSGKRIMWDGNEKFYSYSEWLLYIIEKILRPRGYILNGEVQWSGEEDGDIGHLIVNDNSLIIKKNGEEPFLLTSKEASTYVSNVGFVTDFMRIDIPINLDSFDEIEN